MKKEELKSVLLDDLKICISYESNQENDLLCMMEQYLKSPKKRTELLEEIKHCLNGESYRNPYEVYYTYEEKHIERFEKIFRLLEEGVDGTEKGEAVYIDAILQLNALHKECQCKLIDSWRKPKLEEYLLLVAESSNLDFAFAILEDKKGW